MCAFLKRGEYKMAKKTITTIKTIATLGKRELRYTEMDGIKKFDIRVWHGDKYEDGVRFTEDEIFDLRCVMNAEILDKKIGDKDLILTDNKEYALSMVHNGRTYVRPFATEDEMKKLCEILSATDNLLEYDNTPKVEEPVVEQPKKKRGRPKKSIDVDKAIDETVKQTSIQKKIAELTAKTSKEKSKEKPKKIYKDAYEKFSDQFKEYRESQPKNRQRGYELTHEVIVNHIKDIISTSSEYNANAMQEHKNSRNMMSFCQDKAFENADAMMNITSREEANEMLCSWVDEYVGLDDKPEPPKAKAKKSKQKV